MLVTLLKKCILGLFLIALSISMLACSGKKSNMFTPMENSPSVEQNQPPHADSDTPAITPDPTVIPDPTVDPDDPTIIPDPDDPPKPDPNAGLTLDAEELTLNLDEICKLTATYIPAFEEDDKTLNWTSKNEEVALVDKEGNVKAVSVGNTQIICSSADGAFKASCEVTVKLQWKEYTYSFIADLTEYEWAMNPHSDAYVFLVNKDNAIGDSYAPDDLVGVRDTRKDGRATQQLRNIAEAALHALFLEAEANGMLYVNEKYDRVLSVTSAYRTYTQQATNFNNKVNSILSANPSYTRAQAEAIAAETINRPGTSEHQTGLCLDMHNMLSAERELATEFGENPAGKWLSENCYKFGYILRYEPDKTSITGIAYESWHFRYVGRYHATRMHELDMCLEEYTEYLNEMGYEFNLAE